MHRAAWNIPGDVHPIAPGQLPDASARHELEGAVCPHVLEEVVNMNAYSA